MSSELRKEPRFAEIGRVDAPEICLFSGVLVDISSNGCKVRFPARIDVETEIECELKILCARKEFFSPFVLIANISWLKNIEDSCEVGFEIIRSPSTPDFEKFIKVLEEERINLQEDDELLQGNEEL